MAVFATLDDVRALNTHRTYSPSSKPTEDQIEGFLRSANGDLTAILLGQGWTQIEDVGFADDYPEAFDLLKQIAALEAAAFTEESTVALENTSEQSGHVRLLFRQKDEKLTRVLKFGLPGLGGDEVVASPGGAYKSGGDAEVDTTATRPTFEIAEEF